MEISERDRRESTGRYFREDLKFAIQDYVMSIGHMNSLYDIQRADRCLIAARRFKKAVDTRKIRDAKKFFQTFQDAVDEDKKSVEERQTLDQSARNSHARGRPVREGTLDRHSCHKEI